MPSLAKASAQRVVLWVIWFSMVVSIAIYQVELGGGILPGRDAVQQGFQFPMPLVFAQLCIAAAVRWILIPRAKESRKLLVLLIIGLALSEAPEFNGIFLVPKTMPETKMAIFYLSLLSALQFIPFYAGRIGVPPAEGNEPS